MSNKIYLFWECSLLTYERVLFILSFLLFFPSFHASLSFFVPFAFASKPRFHSQCICGMFIQPREVGNASDDCKQGRINHCVGCTVGGGPAARGPHQLPNFYHAVWTFRNHKFRVGVNVTTTTPKVVNFLGERKVHPQRKSWLRIWKGPAPYVGMPPPNG